LNLEIFPNAENEAERNTKRPNTRSVTIIPKSVLSKVKYFFIEQQGKQGWTTTLQQSPQEPQP
jgi:hypothetical protein